MNDLDTASTPPEMTFEQAIRELETIVRQLEEGSVELAQAIDAYERGTVLRRLCEAKLKEAQLRVDRMSIGADGAIRSDPIDKT